MTSMHVIRADRFGPPDVLTFTEVPIPEPGPGQIRVRVEAAAVNFSDVMRRRASNYPFPTQLPYVPGAEVAGTVDALGEGVEGPPVGTPVFAVVGEGGEGGYAQYALANRVIPRPPSLPAEVAAGLLVAGCTAVLLADETARIQAGDTVYVPAAAGGVGTLLVQIARIRGATVLGGASTPEKRALAASRGATPIDTSRDDWPAQIREHAPNGADVLFEMTGGTSLEAGLAALAPFGRAIVYGSASGDDHVLRPEAQAAWLSSPALGQSIQAFNLGLFFGLRPEVAEAAVGKLFELIGTGQLEVPVTQRFPLAAAAAAHRALESRATTGKLVLEPWTPEVR